MFTETASKTVNLDRLSHVAAKKEGHAEAGMGRTTGRRDAVRRTLMGGLIFAAGLVGGLAFDRPGEPLELADRLIDRVVAKVGHKLNERMGRAERTAAHVHTKVRMQADERRAGSGDIVFGVRDAIAGAVKGARAPAPVTTSPFDAAKLTEKPAEYAGAEGPVELDAATTGPARVRRSTRIIYRQVQPEEDAAQEEAVEAEIPEEDGEDLTVPAKGEVDEVDEKAMARDVATVS